MYSVRKDTNPNGMSYHKDPKVDTFTLVRNEKLESKKNNRYAVAKTNWRNESDTFRQCGF